MSFKSPADVASVFLKHKYGSSLIPKNLRESFGFGIPTIPDLGISEKALTLLIQTMFFVSTAAEEGRINPVGIVFAKALTEFQSETEPAWDVVGFSPYIPFNVEQVAKLASACAWPRSLFAVIGDPDGTDFAIAGIVTPQDRHFFSRDMLTRVLAPKPGVVDVCQGESVVIRYGRGALQVKMSPPAHNRHRPELDSIQQAVFGEHAMKLPIDIREYLLRIVEAIADLGRGGLLAILGPSEEPKQHFIIESKKIEPLLSLGEAIAEMYETAAPPTIEQLRDEDIAMKAEARVAQLLEQVTRLTTVDGAVIMSHRLDVLAFGAKLEVPSDFSVEMATATEGPNFEPWLLKTRGTRHRAAAVFVARVPGRLAVIVSQDGDAAMFGWLNGKLTRWPIWAISKR